MVPTTFLYRRIDSSSVRKGKGGEASPGTRPTPVPFTGDLGKTLHKSFRHDSRGLTDRARREPPDLTSTCEGWMAAAGCRTVVGPTWGCVRTTHIVPRGEVRREAGGLGTPTTLLLSGTVPRRRGLIYNCENN